LVVGGPRASDRLQIKMIKKSLKVSLKSEPGGLSLSSGGAF
jgi:hypothetical protein